MVRRAIPATARRRRAKAASQPRPVEVLVSGGIDSAALLAFYLRERFDVRPLFVDFGQPAAKQELRAARAVCKHYGVRLSIMTVRSRVSFSVGEIPGRNAFLLFAAVLVSGGEKGEEKKGTFYFFSSSVRRLVAAVDPDADTSLPAPAGAREREATRASLTSALKMPPPPFPPPLWGRVGVGGFSCCRVSDRSWRLF